MFPRPRDCRKCSAMTTMMISRMTSLTHRSARCAAGTRANRRRAAGGNSKSNLGITWVAVRW